MCKDKCKKCGGEIKLVTDEKKEISNYVCQKCGYKIPNGSYYV